MGSALTTAQYDFETSTLVGGMSYEPNEKFLLALDAAWNRGEASFLPWDISVPEAPNVHMVYEYDLVYSYTDLDTSRVEIGAEATYRFTDQLWLRGTYRWLDFSDDAPYLSDTTGSASFYHLGLGWRF